jgi:hypothetical protein
VLTCDKETFNGRLSCSYDRLHRLAGYWEVALVDFTKTESPLYVLCDLVDYSYVNNAKVQLLDCVNNTPHQPNYIKLMHKRFSSLNIDIKQSTDTVPQFKQDITCVLHFRRSPFL